MGTPPPLTLRVTIDMSGDSMQDKKEILAVIHQVEQLVMEAQPVRPFRLRLLGTRLRDSTGAVVGKAELTGERGYTTKELARKG